MHTIEHLQFTTTQLQACACTHARIEELKRSPWARTCTLRTRPGPGLLRMLVNVVHVLRRGCRLRQLVKAASVIALVLIRIVLLLAPPF